ncbi:MAG: hypothetical protein WC059_00615 [Candidatus Paceibacterota bacterium]
MEKSLKFFAMALVVIGAMMFIPNAISFILDDQFLSVFYFFLSKGLMAIGLGVYLLKHKNIDRNGRIIGYSIISLGVVVVVCLPFSGF